MIACILSYSVQVGFTSEGVIQALELKLYSNAGYSVDLSDEVNAITDIQTCSQYL